MEKHDKNPQSSFQDEAPITVDQTYSGVKDPEKAPNRDSEQELASTPVLITDDEETSRPAPAPGDAEQNIEIWKVTSAPTPAS